MSQHRTKSALNYIVYVHLYLAFFIYKMFKVFIHVLHIAGLHSFLELTNIALYVQGTFVDPLIHHWVVSRFWLL